MRSRVLIVDDEEAIRTTVQRFLSRNGLDVDTAAGGEEAIRLMGENPYDVAVIDLRMPDTDGFAVMDWMRRHAPGVVPMVLSGTSRVEDALRAVQQGAYDFVSKPLNRPDVFLQHIRRAIEHKRLMDTRARLIKELQTQNQTLENRNKQLELAHSILQSQAIAMQVDLNRAMRIQQGLLPKKVPFSDKLSISAIYRPMAKVGGDFYDVFQMDSHRLGIYIADTSGHGISSAMLTTFLKHAVQGLMWDRDSSRSPGQILTDLNTTIVNESFGQGIFVSMTYLIIDIERMTLTFSTAGHPPLLLFRQDEDHRRLHKPGPVLGVNPRVIYTDEERMLKERDFLVLFTDGITEARNIDGEFFGEERLQHLIENTEKHTDTIARAVEAELARFTEGRQHTDDFTLIVLGMEPQRAEFAQPVEEPTISGIARRGVVVLTSRHDGRRYISIEGTGSWRESQQILSLCNDAHRHNESAIILDLSHCTHLDSTFLGVLHNISTSFEVEQKMKFELQNLPRTLLQEMSDLGLSTVLMHFRPEPVPLPEDMEPVEGGVPAEEEMGRLLLWAHEALVDADPSNADRFAAVLQVLHDQAKLASADPAPREDEQESKAEGEDEPEDLELKEV
jgi:serine phosphatase RsbU (regulator of sigma subunit)/anti-anti-sigma regulatory factor